MEDPDKALPDPGEIRDLINEAGQMLPAFKAVRIIRAYSGIRTLLRSEEGGDSRKISRTFRIIDHQDGMFSILGGKLTTYRLMAEKMTDVIVERLGLKVPCSTAERPLEGQRELSGYPLSRRLGSLSNIVCECELVTKEEVERTVNRIGIKYLSDISTGPDWAWVHVREDFALTARSGYFTIWAGSRLAGFNPDHEKFFAAAVSGIRPIPLGRPTPGGTAWKGST